MSKYSTVYAVKCLEFLDHQDPLQFPPKQWNYIKYLKSEESSNAQGLMYSKLFTKSFHFVIL